MFLVLLSTTIDDWPLYLSLTREGAESFAATIEGVPESTADVFGMDPSGDLICVKIVEFSNGIPVKVDVFKDFEV